MNIYGIKENYSRYANRFGVEFANEYIDGIVEEMRQGYCLLAPHYYPEGTMTEEDAEQFEITKQILEAVKIS